MSHQEVEALLGTPVRSARGPLTGNGLAEWEFWDEQVTIVFQHDSVYMKPTVRRYTLRELWDRFWNSTTFYLPPPPQTQLPPTTN